MSILEDASAVRTSPNQVVMLVAIMLMNETGTDLQLNACDTNQDGIINIEDVVHKLA